MIYLKDKCKENLNFFIEKNINSKTNNFETEDKKII